MTLVNLVIAVTGVIAATAAIIALIYSQRANTTAKAALQQEVLAKLMFEYRTAEMLVAVRALWEFQRKNPDNIADTYGTCEGHFPYF